MADWLASPALLLIAGSLAVPLLRPVPRRIYMLALPVVGLALLLWLPDGESGRVEIFGLELVTLRVDKLSFVFALVFLIAGILAVIYSWHVRDNMQQVAALIYAGGGIGATLAGDLVTLLLYWELTAISSAFLIWARRTERAFRVGMRYLLIQVSSGVVLLAGIAVHYVTTGNLSFDAMTLAEPGAVLIFVAFGVKCAFPLLHNWLQDAYPEATVTGTVVLSIYTTKLAVYTLARGFPGTEQLVWIGVAMTLFPVIYAVIENDLRRVLSYSLNNQLGFMVVGIGIGTELAINGAVAHAFAHIIYKALLFMAMGAVLYRVGTIKASELGGLYRTMPWTAGFCIVGSASISAFPLLSGFVTKSMILSAALEDGRWVAYVLLLVASAAVVDHSGIKVPFFAFFSHDSGKRPKEAPANMLAAMGLAAALCLAIGLYPQPLYDLLPHAVTYSAFTGSHLLTQLQLLLFAVAGFVFLYRRGWYPAEIRAVNLDSDWTYRWLLPRVWWRGTQVAAQVSERSVPLAERLRRGLTVMARPLRLRGWLGAAWSTGAMVWWVALLLGLYLVLALR
ncbi:MAG TPA: Na(+)/H(+) antiporter subunit D [Jiangellaceae bacterium]